MIHLTQMNTRRIFIWKYSEWIENRLVLDNCSNVCKLINSIHTYIIYIYVLISWFSVVDLFYLVVVWKWATNNMQSKWFLNHFRELELNFRTYWQYKFLWKLLMVLRTKKYYHFISHSRSIFYIRYFYMYINSLYMYIQ